MDDLEAIARFIERDSPAYARAVVSRLVAATERLADFPRSGRVVPELGREDIREVLVWQYRIIHRVERERVVILTVVHGKRRLGMLDETP